MLYLVAEDKEKELHETYMAQVLWTATAIMSKLGGTDLNIPQYVEIIYPETKQKEQSAQEIKDHVIRRLLEG